MTTKTEEQEGTKPNPSQALQELWDEIDAEESGGAQAAREQTDDEPGERAGVTSTDDQQGPAEEAAPAAGTESSATTEQSTRDEIAGLKTALEQTAHRLRQAEGHIGRMNRELTQRAQQAAEATRKAGEEAPSSAQVAAATKSPEALQRLIDDYPEFGAAIKEVVDSQQAQLAELKSRIETSTGQKLPEGVVTEEQLQERLVDLTIETSHKGWRKTVQSPEFKAWLPAQPREVQLLARSSDPEDAIRLLDLHKTARDSQRDQTNQLQQRRQQNLRKAAALPTGRSSAAVKLKDTDQMTDEEFWSHLDATEA